MASPQQERESLTLSSSSLLAEFSLLYTISVCHSTDQADLALPRQLLEYELTRRVGFLCRFSLSEVRSCRDLNGL